MHRLLCHVVTPSGSNVGYFWLNLLGSIAIGGNFAPILISSPIGPNDRELTAT
jgi:hypothetical protein